MCGITTTREKNIGAHQNGAVEAMLAALYKTPLELLQYYNEKLLENIVSEFYLWNKKEYHPLFGSLRPWALVERL